MKGHQSRLVSEHGAGVNYAAEGKSTLDPNDVWTFDAKDVGMVGEAALFPRDAVLRAFGRGRPETVIAASKVKARKIRFASNFEP